MPRILTGLDTQGRPQNEMGLYDRFAEGEPSVIATKVLDITDVAPNNVTQAIIKFASDANGTIVQFQDRHQVDVDTGMSTHFYLDEGLAAKLDDYFVSYSWGFKPNDL